MNKYITIDGFEKLTKQEMFDISAKHILSTRTKSTASGGFPCEYAGRGCAAAPFIKMDMRSYADTIQGFYANSSAWLDLMGEKLVPMHEASFVAALQKCHDKADSNLFMEEFICSMRYLARRFDLNTYVFEE